MAKPTNLRFKESGQRLLTSGVGRTFRLELRAQGLRPNGSVHDLWKFEWVGLGACEKIEFFRAM